MEAQIRWLEAIICAIRRFLGRMRVRASQAGAVQPRTGDGERAQHAPVATMGPVSGKQSSQNRRDSQEDAPSSEIGGTAVSPIGNMDHPHVHRPEEVQTSLSDTATGSLSTGLTEGPGSASENAVPVTVAPETESSDNEGPVTPTRGQDQPRERRASLPPEGVSSGDGALQHTEDTQRVTSADAAKAGVPTADSTSPGQQPSAAPLKAGIPPEKHGGRPRETGATASSSSSTTEREAHVAERRPQPELICWRQGMNWVVGAEVFENSTPARWVVTQTSTLPEDEQRPGRWPLTEPLGPVDLVHDNGGESFRFPGDAFRIFKLFGSQHDRGRHMKSLTRGRFLVVTPLDWARDTESGAREIMAPEYVVGARYRSHHLQVADDLGGPPAFITAADRLELPTQSPGFELEGDRLPDAHPEAGPLFHGSPPQLRSLRNVTYRTVVVGEEGPRERTLGWRAAAADFEELRPSIAARRAGWFFMRLYDENDDLIDGLDFRFSAQLQAIEEDAVPPIPSPDGHSPAHFRLVHGEDCEVEPVGTSMDGLFVTRKQNDGHSIEIPPLPHCDETRWTIRERNGAEVETCLRVDRVWWSVADEASEPAAMVWKDRRLELRAEDLAATSRRVLRVRLPTASFAREVRVGVEPDRSLALRPIAGRSRELQLPLRNLGRFSELADRTANVELKLWILADGGGSTDRWEVAVARMCAAQSITEPGPRDALWLKALNPVHVMTLLTDLRHTCGGGHKRMIDQLRREHYNPGRRRRHRDRVQREDFLRMALCVLALIIEEHAASHAGSLVAARWARRAQLARTAFPDVFESVRVGWPTRPASIGTRISPR